MIMSFKIELFYLEYMCLQRNTSLAVQRALPYCMQLGKGQNVEEVRNTLFEVRLVYSQVGWWLFFFIFYPKYDLWDIIYLLECIPIQLLGRLKRFLYLCIDRKKIEGGKIWPFWLPKCFWRFLFIPWKKYFNSFFSDPEMVHKKWGT